MNDQQYAWQSDWEAAWHCDHPVMRWRKKTNTRAVLYYRQCDECGEYTKIAKSDVPQNVLDMPLLEVDIELERRRHKAKWDDWAQRRDAERAEASAEWWRRYNLYLTTPEWQHRRSLVLRRANGICEGCAEWPATQVHHLTYERVGREMLFDLVAICDDCHKRIHDKQTRHAG